MEQSPSSEANRFSASQEIPRILQNTKFHYRIHNNHPFFPILSQMNPVHASYLTLSFILILSAHLHLDLRSGLFPLGFPAETLYASLLSPIRATF